MEFKNEVLKCIYTRRSVRNYLSKPVPRAIINELLNAGVMAPSAMNRQPWRFTIVEGVNNVRRFGEAALKQWGVLRLAIKTGIKLIGAQSIFYNAPLLIIISGSKGYEWLKDDVNLCVENMFLTAHSLGLGSCWIGYAKTLNSDKEALRELGVQPDCEIVAPLIFGYPAKEKKLIPKRKPKILKWIKQ